jgi:hypothetical protein
MFRSRSRLILAISVCVAMTSGSGQSRAEDDPRGVLAVLASAACPWDRLFDGLEIRYTTRASSVKGSTPPPQTESFVYSQVGRGLWRLDMTLFDGLHTTRCRYDDLYYGVFDGQFRTVGYEASARASNEENLLARNPLLGEATAILGEPITQMLRMPGFAFEALEDPQHEGSTRRAVWRLEGAKDGVLPATGVIEWREEEIGALITHLEYRRKTGEATAPSVILVDVEYRNWDGRLLPSRAIRNNGVVIEETVLEAVAPAVPDRAHYSPQAFGLAVPRRPWSRWLITGVILAIAALVVVTWRWFSNR